MTTRKLWFGFIAVMVISFAVLLWFGKEIYLQAPPVPEKALGATFSALEVVPLVLMVRT